MKNLSCIPFAFSCLLLSASCIEEKLDACPPQGGNVAVTLRVERFQTRPPYRPSDLEPEFAERIHSLDYLLYAEGRLIGQGRTTYEPPTETATSSVSTRFRSETTGWRSPPTPHRA